MQITYSQSIDALYIKLTDHPVARSQKINQHVALDLDENGEVIGIEVLHAQKLDIDPLKILVEHISTDQQAERPDQEAIRQGRIARAEARKRQQEAENAK
jgi:uncharacterized protein YuzE